MKVWLDWVRGALRSRLWPMPTVVVVAAVAVGLTLPRLDARIDHRLPRWLGGLMFGGDPGAARTVLDAIASSLITVTSLTFSLTVVTLQLASSQFSPRLLRTFTRDLFVQATLALFLGTFAFSLAVLRSVRSASGDYAGFVPRIAVTAAFLLALVSVLALVLFLAHLARQIRVETMLRTVHDDTLVTIRQTFDGDSDDGSGARDILDRADGTVVDWAGAAGFLVRVDQAELLALAVDKDAVISIDRDPGSFLVPGTPLGRWWTRSTQPSDRDDLADSIRAAVHSGPERTEHQDLGYGLRQLTDVAVKALSPGINDPTTAVHALDHTAAVLCALADRRPGPRVVRDEDGRARVALRSPDLGDLLELALAQPRRYGAADPVVLGRLVTLVGEVARHARPGDLDALTGQLDRIADLARRQDFDAIEAAQLRRLADDARRVMGAAPRR